MDTSFIEASSWYRTEFYWNVGSIKEKVLFWNLFICSISIMLICWRYCSHSCYVTLRNIKSASSTKIRRNSHSNENHSSHPISNTHTNPFSNWPPPEVKGGGRQGAGQGVSSSRLPIHFIFRWQRHNNNALAV